MNQARTLRWRGLGRAALVLLLVSACREADPVVLPGDPTAARPTHAPAPPTSAPTDACGALPTRVVTAHFPAAAGVEQRRGRRGAFQCAYRWSRPGGGDNEVALNITPERFASVVLARAWLDDKLEELARGVPTALRRRQVNVFRSVYLPVEGLDRPAHWSATQNVLVWIRGTEVLWLKVDVAQAPQDNLQHAVQLARHLVAPGLDPAAASE